MIFLSGTSSPSSGFASFSFTPPISFSNSINLNPKFSAINFATVVFPDPLAPPITQNFGFSLSWSESGKSRLGLTNLWFSKK